jgi:hypothetical protein
MGESRQDLEAKLERALEYVRLGEEHIAHQEQASPCGSKAATPCARRNGY